MTGRGIIVRVRSLLRAIRTTKFRMRSNAREIQTLEPIVPVSNRCAKLRPGPGFSSQSHQADEVARTCSLKSQDSRVVVGGQRKLEGLKCRESGRQETRSSITDRITVVLAALLDCQINHNWWEEEARNLGSWVLWNAETEQAESEKPPPPNIDHEMFAQVCGLKTIQNRGKDNSHDGVQPFRIERPIDIARPRVMLAGVFGGSVSRRRQRGSRIEQLESRLQEAEVLDIRPLFVTPERNLFLAIMRDTIDKSKQLRMNRRVEAVLRCGLKLFSVTETCIGSLWTKTPDAMEWR
ncbi:hypothetical protein DFH06DRAFT_1119295 [Mycena polygramma]|nr:hypothetical protein DFH06DRAFT_1119295 [Mycena polygramma]